MFSISSQPKLNFNRQQYLLIEWGSQQGLLNRQGLSPSIVRIKQRLIQLSIWWRFHLNLVQRSTSRSSNYPSRLREQSRLLRDITGTIRCVHVRSVHQDYAFTKSSAVAREWSLPEALSPVHEPGQTHFQPHSHRPSAGSGPIGLELDSLRGS